MVHGVCIYVCMYVCTYVRTYVRVTYIHTYIRTYVRTYVLRTYIHTYVCICRTYVHMYIHIHIRMYVRTYVRKYTYVRTYVRIIRTYVYVRKATHVRMYVCMYVTRVWTISSKLIRFILVLTKKILWNNIQRALQTAVYTRSTFTWYIWFERTAPEEKSQIIIVLSGESRPTMSLQLKNCEPLSKKHRSCTCHSEIYSTLNI